MTPQQRTATSRDGTTIAFDVSGDGPALVLVGGAFQHRAIDESTAALAALLAERFTVAHYDRRGRGDSGDTAPYAVAREIEDLAAVIGAVGGSALVYGMSSGAALALEAAAAGLPIERLAIYEPPYIPDATRPTPGAEIARRLAELSAAGRRDDAVSLFLVEAGVPEEALAHMRGTPMWPGLESVAHTLAYDGTIMGDGTVPAARVATIAAPLLVIDGGASPAWAAEAANAVAASAQNARRSTLPEQTHDVAPAVLAPELERFFAD